MKAEDLNIYITHRNLPHLSFDEWDKPVGQRLKETMHKYYQLVEDPATFDPQKDPTATLAYGKVMKTIGTGSEQLTAWKAYVEKLKEHFPGVEIQRDIKLQPGVGAIFTLRDNTYDGFTITQKLHVYHSLLGPFYTVFGVNLVYYYNGEYNSMVFDSIITAAPIDEYKELFEAVLERLKEDFPESTFMSFQVARSTYPGFRTGWVRHEGDHSLLQALFMNRDLARCAFRGNLMYGYEEWTDRQLDGHWTAYPPNHPPK